MKKLLTLTALFGAAAVSFGQGYVNFGNGSSSLIKTNGATASFNAGGTSGAAWAYELFVAPTTTTTVDASLSGWTPVASGLNTGSGRMLGYGTLDTSSVQVPGFAAGASANFVVVGWSANLGTSWSAIAAGKPTTLVSGIGAYGQAASGTTADWGTFATALQGSGGAGPVSPNGQLGAWYGISPIASSVQLAPAGGPYNSVFGLATSGLIPGFTMNYYAVPEPGTLALAGLGAAAMLIFRRRK